MPYADPEKRKEYSRNYIKEYRKKYPEKYKKEREYNKKFRQKPEQILLNRVNAQRRRARVKGAIECDCKLTRLVIRSIYAFRDMCNEITGISHHVDHVIPLAKGGKHVPWNLDVLTATENLRKRDGV